MDPYRDNDDLEHVTLTRREYERLLRAQELWDRVEDLDYVELKVLGPPHKRWNIAWWRYEDRDTIGPTLRETVEKHFKLYPLQVPQVPPKQLNPWFYLSIMLIAIYLWVAWVML